MKLSFITPTSYVRSHQVQGDFVLGLSHLMKNNTKTNYEKAIVGSGLPIILDNGLFENHVAEGIPSLIEKAIRVKATHVFVPDCLYDSKQTQKNLDEAIKYLKKIKGYKPKIAAVIQAKNADEFWNQLDDFESNPHIDLIGLSILAVPTAFRKNVRKWDVTKSRMYLLRKMAWSHIAMPFKKKYHLLGLGDSYEDVFYAAKHCPFVVSNDTSSAFWNGVQGRLLFGNTCEVRGGKTPVPVDFGFKNASPLQLKRAQRNINLVKDNIKKYDSQP